MNSTQIWVKLNKITPKKPVYNLACLLAGLDKKTQDEMIKKYQEDLSLSEKELNQEIRKQKLRRIINEL